MVALGLFLIFVFAFLGLNWLRQQPPNLQVGALRKLGLGLALLLVAILALSGRLHLVGLLLALGYPLLRRYLPGLMQKSAADTASTGNQSTVRSDILEMTLDHDSGTMQGQVLQGPLQGQSLSDLEEQQFIELLQYCRQQDADSARLLETYLDRRFGESWQQDDPGASAGDDASAGNNDSRASGSGEMSREEALEILGLDADASRDDIAQAHRRLMQRMHPDRGGSAYLAARINAARACLLD